MQRDIRRLAMQLLYQIDLRGEADLEAIRPAPEPDADNPDPIEVSSPAYELAKLAWEHRVATDVLATELAPAWPTHRQPPVDRAILRLAHYEITSGRTPVKVAINEAVELAKHFGGENSPAFINGLLDKMARRAAEKPTQAES